MISIGILAVKGCFNLVIVTDPIYGPIEAYDEEVQLMHAPFFRRLQSIKQLGVACLTFPSATHTRFEHCVGTMYVADSILGSLSKKDYKDKNAKELAKKLKEQLSIRLLRLCALLHDLGHGPFSHSIEEFLHRNPHFCLTKKELMEWIKRDDSLDIKLRQAVQHADWIWKYLPPTLVEHEDFNLIAIARQREYLVNTFRHIDGDVAFRRLLMIFSGKIEKGVPKELFKILHAIIDSDIDADKIDYLLRDTHHTGFRYSSVDLKGVIDNLCLSRFKKEQEWQIAVKKEGVLPVEALLLTRNRHFDTLTTNAKQRRFEIAFVKALEKGFNELPEQEVKKILYKTFIEFTDDVFLYYLKHKYKIDLQDQLSHANKIVPVFEARWGRFLPNVRYDLFMVWRNGEYRRAFESHLEKELFAQLKKNFVVELSFHGKLPGTLVLSAIPGFVFLYDYSVLIRDFPEVQFRNGKINIYSERQNDLRKIGDKVEILFFPPKEMIKREFYEKTIKRYLSDATEEIRSKYNDSPIKRRCRDVDRLLALMYFTEDIAKELYDEKFSNFENLGTRTQIYSYIREVDKLFNGFFSYSNKIYAVSPEFGGEFYYHQCMYEDLQILKALQLLIETPIPITQEVKKGRSTGCATMYIYTTNRRSLEIFFSPLKRPLLCAELEKIKEKYNDLKEALKEVRTRRG